MNKASENPELIIAKKRVLEGNIKALKSVKMLLVEGSERHHLADSFVIKALALYQEALNEMSGRLER